MVLVGIPQKLEARAWEAGILGRFEDGGTGFGGAILRPWSIELISVQSRPESLSGSRRARRNATFALSVAHPHPSGTLHVATPDFLCLAHLTIEARQGIVLCAMLLRPPGLVLLAAPLFL